MKIIAIIFATLMGGSAFAGSSAAPEIYRADDPELGSFVAYIETETAEHEAPEQYLTISVRCIDKRKKQTKKLPAQKVVFSRMPICHFRVCDESVGAKPDPACKQRQERKALEYDSATKIVTFHYSDGAACDDDHGLKLDLRDECKKWQK